MLTQRPFELEGRLPWEEPVQKIGRHIERNLELYVMVLSVAIALTIPLAIAAEIPAGPHGDDCRAQGHAEGSHQ
jgi:hypothetical protein